MILIPPEVIWDVVDGCVVICNLDSGKRLELNSTAGLIWNELQSIPDLAPLSRRVGEIFPEVPTIQLSQDVEDFVTHLLQEGFLDSGSG